MPSTHGRSLPSRLPGISDHGFSRVLVLLRAARPRPVAADAPGMKKRERDGEAGEEVPATTRARHSGEMAHSNGAGNESSKSQQLQQEQSSKSRKYDRQLRLWGEQGQEALEQAAVCLLNSGPTGAEALKNLVLGGIGSVTVVDPGFVQPADLGNNFLLSVAELGQSRAKVVSSYLREMNDSVVIEHLEAAPESLLQKDPAFFGRFTLVIATQMGDKPLVLLDEICRRHGVVLLVARSYGLAGYARVSLKEHTVVESKPDNTIDDLRLHKPWPELKKFVDEFDIETRDPLVHKHIPYGVILVKLAEEWKCSHGQALPATSTEKSEFKALVASKKHEEDEDNYREAVTAAGKVWAPPRMSSEVRAVLEDDATNVDPSSSDFWILVAALKRFMANEGEGDFPLDGSIPDMHSFTEYYIQLQKVYQARAEADVSAVEGHVRSILKEIGRDLGSISRPTIKNFCKNSRNIRVLRYPSLADEFSPKAGSKLAKYLSSEGPVYLLFRAVEKFAEAYGRLPGVVDEEVEEDVPKLKAMTSNVVSELGLDGAEVEDDLVYEFCRYGAAELHCVAAVVGGIASQEAIKMMTKQLTPASGTLVYNAITSTTAVLEL